MRPVKRLAAAAVTLALISGCSAATEAAKKVSEAASAPQAAQQPSGESEDTRSNRTAEQSFSGTIAVPNLSGSAFRTRNVSLSTNCSAEGILASLGPALENSERVLREAASRNFADNGQQFRWQIEVLTAQNSMMTSVIQYLKQGERRCGVDMSRHTARMSSALRFSERQVSRYQAVLSMPNRPLATASSASSGSASTLAAIGQFAGALANAISNARSAAPPSAQGGYQQPQMQRCFDCTRPGG